MTKQKVTPRTLRCKRCGRGPVNTKDSGMEKTGVCSGCREHEAKQKAKESK